jgi:hypothetical protein
MYKFSFYSIIRLLCKFQKLTKFITSLGLIISSFKLTWLLLGLSNMSQTLITNAICIGVASFFLNTSFIIVFMYVSEHSGSTLSFNFSKHLLNVGFCFHLFISESNTLCVIIEISLNVSYILSFALATNDPRKL